MNYTSKEVYKFISKQTNDPIVERKTCRLSGQSFAIYQSDMDFYDKVSPTFAGKRFQIPAPTLCPEERMRRRFAWRNERSLYKRKCDATGAAIISNYSPDKPHTVYHIDQWYSDAWDPRSYGIPYSDDTYVFDHIYSVITSVPNISLMVKMNENCSYVNGCGNSKNCYLVFDTDYCEDSYYSSILKHSKSIVDCTHVYYCEVCYDCVNCTESSYLFSCTECDQSSHLINCSLCSGCRNCYGCTNLVNKEYHIFNKQVTKEAYEKFIASADFNGKKSQGFQRATYKVGDEGGIGNNLYNSHNCRFSYNIGYSENLSYCDMVTDCQDCHDISSFGGTTQWSYNSVSIGMDCSHIYFSSVVTAGSYNIWYSYAMIGCKHCFGCSHMVNAEYCIFNKQYSKEEYEKTVVQIVGQMREEQTWGEFLDPRLSPFGYNETLANEHFPASQELIEEKGFLWSDYNLDATVPTHSSVVEPSLYSKEEWTALRNDENLTTKILICEITGRPFRLIDQEIAFYRRFDLPLPKLHPDTRHGARTILIPQKILHLRRCDKTGQPILSAYSSDAPFPVYSEEAYKEMVFGKKSQ